MRPWNWRTALRTVLAASLATLFTLKASIGDGLTAEEMVDLAYAFFGTVAIWVGVGAIPGSPTEPFLNQGSRDVDVPKPPADPVPAEGP